MSLLVFHLFFLYPSHPTVVEVAVVGLTNNVPVRLSSPREELPVSH